MNKNATENSPWISVDSEEKPNHDQPLIIRVDSSMSYYPGRYISTDEFDGVKIGKGFYEYEGYEPITVHDLLGKLENVTYWMPLPLFK